MQLTCERALRSEIYCRLDVATFIGQRSQELKQLQTAQLRQPPWMEYDYYQVVLMSASGEVATIVDNDRSSLEDVVNQVNDFIHRPENRTLNTSYNIWWKEIWLIGFLSLWFIVLVQLLPVPLFIYFRFVYIFDKVRNQATCLRCALLEKRQETWQLDNILNVQLDEEQTGDNVFYHITLMLNSGEQASLLSSRELPMQRTQFARATHRIRQFLNMDE
ncbi:hypothetical protein [Fischerella sp. JS2]|uniref:hypothetical protein n=1 Tax=Fischerella sp. JS2 TaxID=2597771 RepID=UPI0028E96296|nr:hypothetical protein [Fischerella sp. JS2]